MEEKTTLYDCVQEQMKRNENFFKVDQKTADNLETIWGILKQIKAEGFYEGNCYCRDMIYQGKDSDLVGDTRREFEHGILLGAEIRNESWSKVRGLQLSPEQTLDHESIAGLSINGTYKGETYRVTFE